MPKITIKGKTYEFQSPSKITLLPLAKYLMALDLTSPLGLTDEIAQAAASALKRIIPDIDPAIATPEGLEGLDVEGMNDLIVDLFSEIPVPLQPMGNNSGISSIKSQQIASLKMQLQQLENS
jgi:hypothetical protein